MRFGAVRYEFPYFLTGGRAKTLTAWTYMTGPFPLPAGSAQAIAPSSPSGHPPTSCLTQPRALSPHPPLGTSTTYDLHEPHLPTDDAWDDASRPHRRATPISDFLADDSRTRIDSYACLAGCLCPSRSGESSRHSKCSHRFPPQGHSTGAIGMPLDHDTATQQCPHLSASISYKHPHR
ncbi:hypothetical protein BKA80DRAFT_145832 [Phyllosticta citrichinensis]